MALKGTRTRTSRWQGRTFTRAETGEKVVQADVKMRSKTALNNPRGGPLEPARVFSCARASLFSAPTAGLTFCAGKIHAREQERIMGAAVVVFYRRARAAAHHMDAGGDSIGWPAMPRFPMRVDPPCDTHLTSPAAGDYKG